MSHGSWGAQPKGVGGFSSLYKDSRKKVTASSENYRCQKCLEVGHFTYECKGERKYVAKTSRTVMLKRRIEGDAKGDTRHGKQKKVEDSSSSGKLGIHLSTLVNQITLYFQTAAATVTAAAVTRATPAAVRTTARKRRKRRRERRSCQKRRNRSRSYSCCDSSQLFCSSDDRLSIMSLKSIFHYITHTNISETEFLFVPELCEVKRPCLMMRMSGE